MKLLTLILCLLPSLAFAQEEIARALGRDQVEVRWKVSYTDANGDVVRSSSPSKSYLQTLKGCGYTPTASNLAPVSLLRCPGVLDLSTSTALRERVTQILTAALKQSRVTPPAYQRILQDIEKINFGISPYGIFRSARDGLGDPRRMGLNVSGLVVLNQHYWQLVNQIETANAFLLHEALGAAGYDDQDYQTSLEILEISRGRASPLPPLQRINLETASKEEGGISVVGHGGDSDQQIIKLSLLRAIESTSVQLNGVDPKFLPSKKELRAVVDKTPITIVNYFTLNGSAPSLCRSYDGKVSHPGLCGGFALKAAGGLPFLLVAREFTTAPKNIQVLLIEKIYTQIVSELARAKMK